MEIKPVYIKTFLFSVLIILFLFDSFSFLTSSASGLNIIPAWAAFTRNFLVLFCSFLYLFFKLNKTPVKKPELVSVSWKSILWLGSFILLSVILNVVSFDTGFHKSQTVQGITSESSDNISFDSETNSASDPLPETSETEKTPVLLPNSFFSLFASYVFGIGLFVFVVQSWNSLRNFVYFKRTAKFELNFRILLGLIIATGIVELASSQSGSIMQAITIILYVLVAIYIGLNSFRLGWVLYVTRRDKIISIFLIITILILGLVILSTDLLGMGEPVSYLSPFIFNFIRFTLIYIISFSFISLFSIIFHLPTTEAFERKSSELSSLHSLSKLVSNVFDLNELSQAVVNYSLQTTLSEIGWLELYHTKKDGTHSVKILAPQNINSSEIQQLVDTIQGNMREKLVSTRSLLIIDQGDRSDLLDKKLAKARKILSIAAVPLVARGELVGGLFISKLIHAGFDKDDSDTLSTFADQAAIAIDNTRLFELSLEKERLQQELFIAQKMQMKLLPQTNPVVNGLDIESVSYPAYEVGGDYYDFIVLPEDRFGIIVADVSGKGTSAAFYMAEVKGIFQSLARIYYSPKKLLLEANSVLFGSLERKSFVSLLYCVFDLKKGIVTQSRAGHCPLLVVRADGRSEFVKSPGVGIGMGSSAVIESKMAETEIKLEVGDICVLYSDGVVEAMNEKMDEFGYEQLRRVIIENRKLSAKEILDKLITEVNTFIWNGKANDDLTLVVTKWMGMK